MDSKDPHDPVDFCAAPWLDERRGYLVDWLTQIWVKLTGRVVLVEPGSWLDVPLGEVRGIGDTFLSAFAKSRNLRLLRNSDGGLVERFEDLRSTSFDPSRVHSEIARFYERTSEYELELEAKWCGLFRPLGWMIAFIFSRRLQQLNLPVCRHDSDGALTSEIVRFQDAARRTSLTCWYRTFLRTRQTIYVGFYSLCSPPGRDRLVRVAFPIPNGCALVLMKPEALPDGSFLLESAGHGVGSPGFHFLLRRSETTLWVRRVTSLRETILVQATGEGQLAATHDIGFWGIHALRMSYGIFRGDPRSSAGRTSTSR